MPSFELKPGRCEHLGSKTFASFATNVEKVETKVEADEVTELGSVGSGSAESKSEDEWGPWGDENENQEAKDEPVAAGDEWHEVKRRKVGYPKVERVEARDTKGRKKPTSNSFEALSGDVAGESACAKGSAEVPVLAGKKGMTWPASKKGKKKSGKVEARKVKAADERALKLSKPVDVPEPEVPKEAVEPEQVKTKKAESARHDQQGVAEIAPRAPCASRCNVGVSALYVLEEPEGRVGRGVSPARRAREVDCWSV
jgi:hypothetical protein